MGRCIIVLCTGRDGSSAVGGMLHKMGVHMGDEFEDPGIRVTPFGSYEDKELHKVTDGVLKGTRSPDDYRPYVQKQCSKHEVWGIKHPSLVHTAHYIIPMIQEAGHEVRMVVTIREPALIVNSFMRAWYHGRIYAEKWYSQVSSLRAARMLETPAIPKIQIHYDDIHNNPGLQAARLAQFAFEGIRDADEKIVLKGAAHISPMWNPPKVEGWGKLCFGCRVNKHPEVEFFGAWTHLLLTGIREGDRALVPTKYMPGHWAGTELARQFLGGTNADTLMLFDDDMLFTPDQVARFRDNPASFQYDVLSGLTMRRSVENPSPVLMKSLGDVGLPDSLNGRHYTLRPEFTQGDIVEVDTVGLAFTMIRRHVLEAMVNPAYGIDRTFFFTWGIGHEGDDVPFSQQCAERGFRMAVDTNIEVGHLMAVPLTWTMLSDRVAASREAAILESKNEKAVAEAVVEQLSSGGAYAAVQ